MNKKALYLTILIVLVACSMSCQWDESRSMTITIQNNTDKEIAQAQVWAAGSRASVLLVEQTNLGVGSGHSQAVKYKLGLDSDGTYELRLAEATGQRTFTFGYFTDGGSLNRSISFEVENDTIIVKSEPRQVY